MDIDADFLKKANSALDSRNICETIPNKKYVTGKNPTIASKRDSPQPDNRIPVPLAKIAVNTVVGYAGRPGDITTEYVRAEAEAVEAEPYKDIIKEFQEFNNEDLENSELLNIALSQGVAYEIWWVSDQSEDEESEAEVVPEFRRCPATEAFPVYSESLKPELDAFIRFWKRNEDETHVADVYYPFKKERWEKDSDGDTYEKVDEEETPYSEPAIEFTINMDKMPIYEAEKPIIDSYDSAISNSQNEVDRFNAAILMLPGAMTAASKEEFRTAYQSIFENLDDFENWPDYLQKNLTGVSEFYKEHSANLERLYHKSVGIPDISDENFAGNQSGVAIAFKLLPLEFLVSQIEIYFKEGLQKRKVFYDDFLEFFGPDVDKEEYKAVVTWKRNMPVDEEMKVDIAMALSNLVSQETVLRFLPNKIVPDVEEELEKLDMIVEDAEPTVTS